MRTALEKIALITLVSIGVIFITFIIFIPIGALDVALFDNRLVKILLGIMAVMFVGLGVYLLYMTFSDRGKLRNLVLFSDSESSSKTSSKVIKNLVINEGRKVSGVRVTKVQIRQDDKYGFGLKVFVRINKNDVEECVDQLRCMIADTFLNGLGVKFNTIDFQIEHLSPKFASDKERAKEQAKLLRSKRHCSKDYINHPLDELEQSDEALEEVSVDPSDGGNVITEQNNFYNVDEQTAKELKDENGKPKADATAEQYETVVSQASVEKEVTPKEKHKQDEVKQTEQQAVDQIEEQ